MVCGPTGILIPRVLVTTWIAPHCVAQCTTKRMVRVLSATTVMLRLGAAVQQSGARPSRKTVNLESAARESNRIESPCAGTGSRSEADLRVYPLVSMNSVTPWETTTRTAPVLIGTSGGAVGGSEQAATASRVRRGQR